MATEWTMNEVQNTLIQLYQRASTDPSFRKRCLTDPDGALEEIAGKPPQEKGKVRFTEDASKANQSSTQAVLGLPPQGQALTREQLQDRVGEDLIWPWTSFMKTCRHHPCQDSRKQ